MMMTTQKRKAVDQVSHDFSDFSLSSPATKIRRLDHVELAPIIEEDEQLLQEEQTIAPAAAVVQGEVENEERAIVLFNPNNTIIDSPPTFSLTPHILSRLKDQPGNWYKHSNLLNNSSAQEDEDATLKDDNISNQCLAVVPWVQSHLSPAPQTASPLVQQLVSSETMMMEAELEDQQEISSMDIEQEYNNNGYAAASGMEQRPATEFGGPNDGGFPHWQQQHCMVPSQLPQNAAAAPTPTPVVWFR